MRIALLHPGHALSTAWIYDGYASALEDLGVEVMPIRLDNLISTASDFIDMRKDKFDGDQGANLFQWKMHLAQQLAIPRILECIAGGADLLLNICGRIWTQQNIQLLALIPFQKIIYLTESPYEDDSQKYLLGFNDFAFCNDKSSALPLSEYIPTSYMPHAFDPDVFMPIELETKFDFSFIGTPFGNRKPIVEALAQSPKSGYLFHRVIDEDESTPENQKIVFVPQSSACRVYNSSKVNVNIHRTEKYYGKGENIDRGEAYSLNPRAFEIAACAAFQLCDNTRPELTEIFGDTVATFNQPEEAREAMEWWADPERDSLRREMAVASYGLALNHTYRHRAVRLVDQLARWYNRPDWVEGLS